MQKYPHNKKATKHYQTEINDKKGKRQKYIQNIRYFCTLKYNLIKLNANAEHNV